jgi:hypothetical protein
MGTVEDTNGNSCSSSTPCDIETEPPPSIDLTATPAAGWHFVRFEEITDTDSAEGCPGVASGNTLSLDSGIAVTGHDFDYACRAVFEMDTPGGSYACSAAAPHPGDTSFYKWSFMTLIAESIALAEQAALNPSDGSDGHLTLAKDPTTVTDVRVPGFVPLSAAGAPDGSILVAGFQTAGSGLTFLDLAEDGTLDWQGSIPTGAFAMDMCPYDSGVRVLVSDAGSTDVISVSDAGEIASAFQLDAPGSPHAITCTADGGEVVITQTFNGTQRSSYVTKVAAAGGVEWTYGLTGGFEELNGVAEITGGYAAWGRDGATGSTSNGYLIEFDTGGAATHQLRAPDATPVYIATAFEQDGRLRLVGADDAYEFVLEANEDGSVIGGEYLGGGPGYLMGGAPTADGGVALGIGSSSDGSTTTIVVGPDLTIDSCTADEGPFSGAWVLEAAAVAWDAVAGTTTTPLTPDTVTPTSLVPEITAGSCDTDLCQ